MRSCSSQGGCQFSLTLVPTPAELMDTHQVFCSTQLQRLSLYKGLRVMGSGFWQTQTQISIPFLICEMEIVKPMRRKFL